MVLLAAARGGGRVRLPRTVVAPVERAVPGAGRGRGPLWLRPQQAGVRGQRVGVVQQRSGHLDQALEGRPQDELARVGVPAGPAREGPQTMLTPPFFLPSSAAAGSAEAAPRPAAADSAFAMSMRMWQCLYFLPFPHQHGSLRPSFGSAGIGAAAAAPMSASIRH